MAGGYANRVIRLPFPALTDDPENDPIWVIIRNPRLMPPGEMSSLAGKDSGYEQDEDGKPKVTDANAALGTMHRMVARLVVAARVYDATSPGEFDPETGEPTTEQPRMAAPPWTPEMVAKLPQEIIERIGREFSEAVNPPRGQEPTTANGSSGQPNQSSTEPGRETEPQPS